MSIFNDLSEKWTNLTDKISQVKSIFDQNSDMQVNNEDIVSAGSDFVQNTVNPVTSQINWGTGGLDNKTMLYGAGIIIAIYLLFKK